VRLPAAVVVLLSLSGPGASAAPPSPTKIFACPLGGLKAATPDLKAVPVVLAPLGLQARLPPWLKVKSSAPQRVDLASKSWRLSLRRSRQAPKRGAAAVKRAMERYELRASHISSRCERASLTNVLPKRSLLFTRARLGSYTRPLGQRRRSHALYLELRDGTVMTAVVTGFWRRSRTGPSLQTALDLLGAVAAAMPLAPTKATEPE